VSDSTNRRDVLRQIKADCESTPQLDSQEPLDQIAERYNLGEVLDACRRLKGRPAQMNKIHPPDNSSADPITSQYHERDFTTENGTPSKLECPFAKMANGNHAKELADPIAAEFHGDGSVGSGTVFAMLNPSRCPIRFLDQHSPEEVAKYFERHKHEIPRSHAVCISSYQQDDAKVRQLDAKYGDLQNMIQSLGFKHQRYLPANEGDEIPPRRSSLPGEVVVENWAKNVAPKPRDESPLPDQQPDDNRDHQGGQIERTNNFARSLREIRLGESPSRPWGISVPPAQATAASANPSEAGHPPLSPERLECVEHVAARPPRKENGPPPPSCHSAGKGEMMNGATRRENADLEDARITDIPPRPQMIFNGPVFFGYSSEQATAMMQAGTFAPVKN
jgi:hypothetical protein